MLRPLLTLALVATSALADVPTPPPPPVEFIDTGFENASPLWYEFAPDGAYLAARSLAGVTALWRLGGNEAVEACPLPEDLDNTSCLAFGPASPDVFS